MPRRWQESAHSCLQTIDGEEVEDVGLGVGGFRVHSQHLYNTCGGVGETRGRMTISDRDMRSERPEFERCAPLWPHGPRAKKKESNRKLIDFPGLPGSVVKPETANA